MTDRELLELAARAAGIVSDYFEEDGDESEGMWGGGYAAWNPLVNDSDALRLAVMMGLDVEMHGCKSTHPYACAFDCEKNISEEEQPEDGDPYVATRRAIVRAAAEIGKKMGGSDDSRK
jgi:hypothetical protein